MNTTESVEHESEPPKDLDLVFHQSRLSNADEEIHIEPVELLATYELNEADVEDVPIVDSPQKIPFENTDVRVSLGDRDGDEGVHMKTTHYVRFTSNSLLTDIYVPIEKPRNTKQMRWLSRFIGYQGTGSLRNEYFVPQLDTFETTYTRASLGDSKIKIMDQRDISLSERESWYWRPFNILSNPKANGLVKMCVWFMGILAVSFLLINPLDFLTPDGTSIVFSFNILPQWMNMLGATVTLSGVLIALLLPIWKLTELYESENSETFEYQLEKPEDSWSIYTIDDVAEDAGEIMTVTAHLDDGTCVIENVDDGRTWDIPLKNGVMDNQLVEFFESVGAEQITEEFTVRKRPSPTRDTIAADNHTVFFEPTQ